MFSKIIPFLVSIFLLVTLDTRQLYAQNDTVAVLVINDFHGGFVCNKALGVPGAENLLLTIDSLKRVYPCNVVVSAGDNFGGSYFSSITNGVLLPDLFKAAGITYSAVGNHEFDYNQIYLADKWSKTKPSDWSLNYLAANITTEKGELPSWCVPMTTNVLTLRNSGKKIKMAFVGLSPESTPEQTAKGMTDGLHFSGQYVNVLNKLKKESPYKEQLANANIRLLLTHIGTQTGSDGKVEWSVKGDEQNLPKLYPEYSALISGHSHKTVAGKIGDMPIVQGEISGKYVSVLQFVVDTLTLKIQSVEPKLVKVAFHKDIEKTPIGRKIDEVFEANNLNTTAVEATQDLLHSRNDNQKITVLGSHVARAYSEAFKEGYYDRFGLSHFGGIRAPIFKGAVTKYDACEVLPFAADLKVFYVSGKRLQTILEEGLNNNRYGYLQTNPIKIHYYIAPDGRKKISYAEDLINEIALVFDEERTYIVVVDSYVVSGGDGYSPMLFSKDSEITPSVMPTSQTAWLNYLANLKSGGDKLNADNVSIIREVPNTYQNISPVNFVATVLGDVGELVSLIDDYVHIEHNDKGDQAMAKRMFNQKAWFDRFFDNYLEISKLGVKTQLQIDLANNLKECYDKFGSSESMSRSENNDLLKKLGRITATVSKKENLASMVPIGIYAYAAIIATYSSQLINPSQNPLAKLAIYQTHEEFIKYIEDCKKSLFELYLDQEVGRVVKCQIVYATEYGCKTMYYFVTPSGRRSRTFSGPDPQKEYDEAIRKYREEIKSDSYLDFTKTKRFIDLECFSSNLETFVEKNSSNR